MKLYELTSDFLQVMEMLEKEETSETETRILLETIQNELTKKSGNIIAFIKNQESDIKALDDEIKRLSDLKKTRQNKINSLKGYLKNCLETANIKKVETDLGNIGIKKNPPSVVITDESIVPKKYFVKKTSVSLDKTAIMNQLKEGKKVKGAVITQGTSLTIK